MGTIAFLATAMAMTAAVAGWLAWAARTQAAPTEDGAAQDASPAREPLRRRGIVGVVLAAPLIAAGLYAWLGEPAALRGDAALDAQAALDSLPVTAVREELVAHLARNPRDARGHVLLARMDFSEDRFPEAAAGYAKAIAASPKVANDPGILCEYADALGMAQGGRLAGAPYVYVLRALAVAPANPRALEMAGSAAYEQRDYATAARQWRALSAQLADDDPQAPALLAAIARADLLASDKH